jgi:hypothetical protein
MDEARSTDAGSEETFRPRAREEHSHVGLCTLEIGSRTIVRSDEGPPEAEYALFDASCIELAATAPGIIREVGYRTTVGEARARLDAAGVKAELARAAEPLFAGALSVRYALDDEARSVAPLLGASELFDGYRFDVPTRKYEGRWLDLSTLVHDLGLPRGATALQALFLVATLEEFDDDAPVFLSTIGHTESRRAGERTLRRIRLDHARDVPAAARALITEPKPPLPSRGRNAVAVAERLADLAGRAAAIRDPAAIARVQRIAERLSAGPTPPHGPLADPELWSLEQQLARGDARGVIPKLEAYERERGRLPVTTYLRLRAALVAGVAEPRTIAERAAPLFASARSFSEVGLLAAEAWMAAGEPVLASPFAHEIAERASASDAVRKRARELVDEAAQRSAPQDGSPVRTAVRESAAVPPSASARAPAPRQTPEYGIAGVTFPIAQSGSGSYGRSEARLDVLPEEDVHEAVTLNPPDALEIPLAALPSIPPVPTTMSIPPLPPAPAIAAQAARGGGPVAIEAEIVPDARALPTQRLAGAAESPFWTALPGASLPPFESTPPPVVAPTAPPQAPHRIEVVEHLSLPPGLHGQPPPAGRVQSVLEARLLCIHLARELGRVYRVQHRVELRTDERGLELCQGYLRERFGGGALGGPEDVQELRLHGAFLSELIVRELGGHWTDVGPTEFGYWAMRVPPKTTTWPFGRVLRFVTRSDKERDLVGYYRELKSRAFGRTA